jgi:hypothetical protein
VRYRCSTHSSSSCCFFFFVFFGVVVAAAGPIEVAQTLGTTEHPLFAVLVVVITVETVQQRNHAVFCFFDFFLALSDRPQQ